MKTTMMAMGAVFLLSACASTPQPTLEEKLAGKPEAERVVILKEECLKEAAWKQYSGRPSHYSSTSHIRRMKEICEAMSNEFSTQKAK